MSFSSSDIATLFPSQSPKRGTPAKTKGTGEVAGAKEWFPVTDGSIVLAVDPSIAACGWAVLKKINVNKCVRIDSGCWRPRASGDANRFNALTQMVWNRIYSKTDSDGAITDAVIELPNRGGAWRKMSTDDIRANGRAIGAIEAACFLSGLTVNLVRVHEWKGNDKKDRTRIVVKSMLGYDARENNECDALGIGLWLCSR